MQLSLLLLPCMLVASVWSAPSYSSQAQAMIQRQYENTDWANVLVARDDQMIEPLAKRIVYNPHITQPSAKSVWHAGNTYHVLWSTSDMPAAARNYRGEVKLGYLPASGAGGENLHWTLAKGFKISSGKVAVTLPKNLKPRRNYIIVLMGDSGNASPKFTIKSHFRAANEIVEGDDVEAAEGDDAEGSGDVGADESTSDDNQSK